MKVSASVRNTADGHAVEVATDDSRKSMDIPPKPAGRGSSINGGELLFLALATCYCNDVFREAASLGIVVHSLEVDVEGEFGAPGEPATRIACDVRIAADADRRAVENLLRHTDSLAEVQNTLRIAVPVALRHLRVA